MSRRRHDEAARRPRGRWLKALAAFAGAGIVFSVQRRLGAGLPGAGFVPDLYACLALQAAWRSASPLAALGAALGAALAGWSEGIEPFALEALRAVALVAIARAAAGWLDVSYWFVQPFAALAALVASEFFAAAASRLFFGAVAWTPAFAIVATALATLLLHAPLEWLGWKVKHR